MEETIGAATVIFKGAPSVPKRNDSCRILYLIGQLGSGGTERQLYYLLKTINRKRYKPALVVWNFRQTEAYVPHFQSLNIPLYYFPGTLSSVAKLQAFRRLVKVVKPELVHCFSFYLNFAAHFSVQHTNARAIGSLRGDFTQDIRDTPWLLSTLSTRWPLEQICNSFTAAAIAHRSKGFFVRRRLSVVRNGLDLEQFHSEPRFPDGKISVLGIGSLLPYKRWDRLLQAARALKHRGSEFVMRIAGDGPMLLSLRKQAQLLEVSDCVEFLGYTSDIPSLLAEASVLAHTSDTEGCPNVVMEAMACGRPVVATDAGDTARLVDDGITGYLVQREDHATMVERLATLIGDSDLCWQMGQAARAKAEREFGLTRLVEETLAVYQAAGWRNF